MKHLRWLLFLLATPACAQFIPHAPAKGGYCLNPSNVWIPINAFSQTGSALPNGAPAGDLYGLNSNGTWYGLACDANGKLIIPGAGSPAGSNQQIQFNDNGDFAGTSGGTTNGTHFAFGAGSTIDNFPPVFTDGLTNSLAVIVGAAETTTTNTGTNGGYFGITWSPISDTPDSSNLFALGTQMTVDMDGQSTADNYSAATASFAQNNSNTTAVGRILGSDNIGQTNGNGNTQVIAGGAYYAGQLGSGEAALVSGFILLADTEGGITDEMDGGDAALLNAGGEVTLANTFKLESPIAVNVIGTLNGLDIQQQCGAGITTCKAINAEADEPSFIGGPTTFGDILGYGDLTLAEGTANIATAGGEGWTFACSDCDTPAYQGATCTNTGDNAGAVGLAIDGALVCFGKGQGGYPTFRGSGTYTTATSDSFTVTGATASSFCTFSPTNSTAAAAAVLGYVSSVTTNSVTIAHAATVASGGTVNIICTKN